MRLVSGTHRIVSVVVTFVLATALAGCAWPIANLPWGIPEPTRDNISTEDITGSYMDGDTVINLNPDQTFSISGASRLDGNGTWHVAGDRNLYIRFQGPVSDDRPSGNIWIGIVADSRDGGHAIFGGLHADPDYWYWLERVKSVVFDAFCAEDSSLRVMNHLGLILQ